MKELFINADYNGHRVVAVAPVVLFFPATVVWEREKQQN
jgi:hypothetical protein